MYWRSASGYLSNFNKAVVQEIDAIFDMSKTSFSMQDACDVKTKVESLYADAGISCFEVGVWKDAEGCIADACTPTGEDTLFNGNPTYVSGCAPAPADMSGTEPDDGGDQVSSAATKGLTFAAAAAVVSVLA